MSTLNQDSAAAGAWQFTSTHWTVVLAAGEAASPEADRALEQLCQTYWHPLYAFVRRRGYPPHDAQDLTQEFFVRLLDKNYLKAVDRKKGKFRSFLLASLEHFLANEWRRANTQKRGAGVSFIFLDDDSAERQYLDVASPSIAPEKIFEQQWAMTLLNQTVSRLREEFVTGGKGELFDELKEFLTGERQKGRYSELALKLQTSEAALKMAVSRMRQRYGDLLRSEIAHTVSDPAEIEAELRELFAALS